MQDLSSAVLSVHGDVALSQMWMQKRLAVFQSASPVDITSTLCIYAFSAAINSSVSTRSVPSIAALTAKIYETLGFGFGRVEATYESGFKAFLATLFWAKTCRPAGHPEGVKITQGAPDFWMDAQRINHFLVAPDEVDHDAFLRWLPPPAELCTAKDGSFDIIAGMWWGYMGVDGVPEVYERVGRNDDAVLAGEATTARFPFNPFLRLAAATADSRSHAAAGRAAVADAGLQHAVAMAQRHRLPWLEMLACRDALTRLPASMGGRDRWLAALGRAIAAMPAAKQQWPEIDGVLGAGLTAAEAVQCSEQCSDASY